MLIRAMVLVILMVGVLGLGGCDQKSTPTAWEYMVEDADGIDLRSKLAENGKYKWEAYAVVASKLDTPTSGGHRYEIFFKRPKKD